MLLGFLCGAAVGAGVLYLLLSKVLGAERQAHASTRESLARIEAQREAELKASNEKLALLEEAKVKLQESFKALSADALSKNNESFLKLAEENLKKHQESAKGDLEKRQEAIHKTIEPVGEALKLFNEMVTNI